MPGKLLGLLLASIPLSMAGAGVPDMPAREAITLIENAKLNRSEGYFYRAEAQYRGALAIVEQMSGPESPDLTPVLNGLAELYFEAGRYTEAEAFARRSAAVVETGLGGRLDATNVTQPVLTVITPIDFDHEAYLGHTLEAIAGEKAGILKPGVPAVFARQRPEAAVVLE